MLQFWVLLYIAALYVRPGEIVPALADIPLIKYLSAGSGLAAILSLVLDPRKFWDQPHDKSILLYWMAITISNPAWGFFAGGPAAFTDFFPVIFCYFLIRLGIQTVPQVMRVTRLLVWLSVFLAANGLMQVFTGSGFGQVEAMETREGIRIMGTGIFNDPNDLGMALVMIVPFVLSATLRKGTKFFARVVSLAAMATLVCASYYTNSRGTILGLGSVFAAYVYRRYGPVTASVLASAGLVAILAFGPSRMSQVSSEEDSAQGRIQAWAAGMQMFRESPVTGIGYRRFGDVHGLVAHNAFVHVLAELGFIGAMGFVGIFYWYFVRLPVDPEAPSTGSRAWLRLDLADAGMGMLLCMCFLSRQYVVVPFILVALGASYASAVQSGQQPPDDSAPARLMTIGMLTLALVIGFYIIARVFARY